MQDHCSIPRRTRRYAFAAGLLACVIPLGAHAAGLSAPGVGDGRSSPEHVAPSAVYWNPGALGMIERPRMTLGVNIIVGSIRYQRNYRGIYQREDSFDFKTPIPTEDIDPNKSGWAPNSNHMVLGPQPDGHIAVPIGNTGLVIGGGLSAPYVATVNYPANGAQRFHIQDALIAAVELTASLAYRINEHISIGAGATAVIGYAQINRITDFAGKDLLGDALEGPPVHQANDFGEDAPTAVRELDVLARPTALQQMLAVGYTFNVGTMLKFDPVRIGLSYHHSTRLNFRGKFRLDMNNDFFTSDLAAQGLQYKPTVRGDASLSFTLPNSIHLGVGWDISPKISVALAASYTFWSRLQSFDVVLRSDDLAQPELGISRTADVTLPRRWKDSIGVDGFLDYRFSERTAIFGHLGFQQNAVPDATIDASSPDGDRIIIGAGLFHDFPGRFDVSIDATVQHTLPREVTASDYDLGNGKYGLTLLNLGAHIGIKLGKKDLMSPTAQTAAHSHSMRHTTLSAAPAFEGERDAEYNNTYPAETDDISIDVKDAPPPTNPDSYDEGFE